MLQVGCWPLFTGGRSSAFSVLGHSAGTVHTGSLEEKFMSGCARIDKLSGWYAVLVGLLYPELVHGNIIH